MSREFKFKVGDKVRIKSSGNVRTVIAVSELLDGGYLVTDVDGERNFLAGNKVARVDTDTYGESSLEDVLDIEICVKVNGKEAPLSSISLETLARLRNI